MYTINLRYEYKAKFIPAQHASAVKRVLGRRLYCNFGAVACSAIARRCQEVLRLLNTSKTFGFTTLMGLPAV